MVPPKDMSHAEIWDDSVLVNSWNEALEEYKVRPSVGKKDKARVVQKADLSPKKKYHGIHARGEKVGDILKEISKDSNEASDEMDYDEGEVDVEQGINDPQAKIVHESADPVQTTSRNTEQPFLAQNSPDKLSEKNQASAGPSPSIGSPSEGPAVPQHLIGQVQDEALKNLLMSWYYAGYYTGLYEGQQGQKPKPA